MKEIIYSKKYPDQTEIPEEYCDLTWDMPCEEFLQKYIDAFQYVEVPSRVEESKQFISKIIELSELYQFDLEVRRCSHKISADLFLDDPVILDGERLLEFIRLTAMSSELTLFLEPEGRPVHLVLEYFTHERKKITSP